MSFGKIVRGIVEAAKWIFVACFVIPLVIYVVHKNTTAEPPPQRTWQESSQSNPVDDTTTITLSLPADRSRSELESDTPTLFVRCMSKDTDVLVDWSGYLGDDSVLNSQKRVTIRVGAEKAKTETWILSENKTTVFTPGHAVDLVKKMAKGDTFVIQVTPYLKNTFTAVFNVSGLQQAAQRLAKTCGWSF